MGRQSTEAAPSFRRRLKDLIIGRARSPREPGVFHKLSLVAFFAWVGLGVDGLSSACYGPAEAYLALGGHIYLGIFVALATAVTVFVISAGYSQIIELFPSGGGGYLVASKLLSPGVGMVSGCALLIDYVLTIAISIASGADALFSLLPAHAYGYKLVVAVAGVALLTLLNLRGVKESVIPLVPIFLIFLLLHAFAVIYAAVTHGWEFPQLAARTTMSLREAAAQLGTAGMLAVVLRAYTLGAGTYTGIEAVSNGLPLLREPRVQTGKRTMRYMALSLAFLATGLMLGYILYELELPPHSARTLNAIFFERVTGGWDLRAGYAFVLVALVSEAAVLFVAAQTGFLGGPRVLANLAIDRWFPTRFANLSDRLVTQDGILMMGVAAIAVMFLTGGSVAFLIVLYSINVFITFFLSQLGMVRHWWAVRAQDARWRRGLSINGLGLVLTGVILASVVIVKFDQGGWITLLITGVVVVVALQTRRHYDRVQRLLNKLAELLIASDPLGSVPAGSEARHGPPRLDPNGKTAIVLVSGYNALGLHTLAAILRVFGDSFQNFVFVQVGVVDAGTFKGAEDVRRLKPHVEVELGRYVQAMQRHGRYAEGIAVIGTDVVEEILELAPALLKRYPQAVFFGGQLVFPEDSFFTRWLHNNNVFSLQRRFYLRGTPFVILPIRV